MFPQTPEGKMMSEDDKALMAQYGITSEPKLVFCYKEHRYDKLQDAVNFAKLEKKPNEKK
ncbi:MAG: hypothetical protein PVG89_17690 [Gammaproteobacteria bacterium]|jgi:hypothetical protein